jgi:hypothetical protein
VEHNRTTYFAFVVACAAAFAAGCSTSGATSPGADDASAPTDGGTSEGGPNLPDGSAPDATVNAPDGTTPDARDDGALDAGAQPEAAPCVLGAPPDASNTVITCANAVDAGDSICAFSACLSGGLVEAFSANDGCGTVGHSTLDWTYYAQGKGITIFSVNLGTDVPVDQIGPLPVDSVSLDQTFGPDSGVLHWQTPTGSCSVTLTSSTCAPEPVFPNRRILTGTGSCSQPAVPEAGTGGAVTIGDFWFTGFIDPQ